MSLNQSQTFNPLCRENNCVYGDESSAVADDSIQEIVWRKQKFGLVSFWKRECIVLRRGELGIEVFSPEDDSFNVLAKLAIVEPLRYDRGIGRRYRHVKSGFRVKFVTVIDDDDSQNEYGERESCWHFFRTANIFSMVRWMLALDPTLNSPGLRESLLGYECKEQCCDSTGPETWVCRWDEVHPSMLDVRWQYSKSASGGGGDKFERAKKRRTSRAYSRARALSVNESAVVMKSNSTHSNIGFHDSPLTGPESPEICPPRYDDVVGKSFLALPDSDEEKFKEYSPITEKEAIRKSMWNRRNEDDTFLPPYGPAKMVPLNMGTGEEIGLPANIQKMWDPETKKVMYVDHNTKTISLQSPKFIESESNSNRSSLAPPQTPDSVDPLSQIISDCRRLSARRMTSISALGSGSINNCAATDSSPGDDRWLPCYLESQLSAPAGVTQNVKKNSSENFGQLPQINETNYSEDYRIRILRPAKAVLPNASHSWLNMADVMDVVTAEHLAQQALSKPVAIVVDASGCHGRAGRDGFNGQNGTCGMNGRHSIGDGTRGENGYNGTDGEKGEDGECGEDGGNAQDIELWLSVEDSKYMKVTGAVEAKIDINGDRIVLVSCKGGQGGNGGRGGIGGNGGNGGDGGNGSQGLDGDGGPGGNGGDGGSTGQGGNGGRAGNGGNGGMVTIYASDPNLFMLVECDIRGGTSGTPGIAGKPGIPGRGGKGGQGGKGAYYTMYRNRIGGLESTNLSGLHQRNALLYNGGMMASSGFFMSGHEYGDRRDLSVETAKSGIAMTMTHVGRDGPAGVNGRCGVDGESGFMGDEGCWGAPGCVRWVLTPPSTGTNTSPELSHAYFFKYNVEVVAYEIFSNNDDGILEPNELITINNVKVVNTGQMTLPTGAILSFPSTKNLRSYPNQYLSLPEMSVNEMFISTKPFKACIHDVTSPNAPGPFFSHVEVESRVTLLNRDFLDARNIQNFDVQYPLYLSLVESPKQMGRGEEGPLKIEITNLSSITYGTRKGYPIDPETSVELKVRLDRRLSISSFYGPELSVQLHPNFKNPVSMFYFNPDKKDSVSVSLSDVPPRGDKMQVILNLLMENKAELFDNTLLQVELYLRGRLIEYSQSKIRVSPYYEDVGEPGDALFITGPETTRSSFLRWEYLLNSLGLLNVDFWDIERYKGLSFLQNSGSRHEVTWIDRYRGKMIIFPHYKPHQFSGWDISCHFGLKLDEVIKQSAFPITESINILDDDDKTESLASSEDNNMESALILLSDSVNQSMDKAVLVGCLALLTLDERKIKYGGCHFFNPAGACFKTELADRKLLKIFKQCDNMYPENISVAYDRSIDYEMQNNLYWSYGSLILRRFGIDRDSLLTLFCTGNNRLLDITCHPSVFDWVPVVGQWTQVYLVMLASLSTLRRSELIHMNLSKPIFMLPWGETISVQYVATLSIQQYLEFELNKRVKTCQKLESLAYDIKEHPNYYKDQIPLLLYILLEYQDKTTSFIRNRKMGNKIKQLIFMATKSLQGYYGERNMKTWTREANMMLKYGPKLRFTDLVDPQYSFYPSHMHTTNDMLDLSKYLTETEYDLIDSINSLSQ